MKNKLSVAIALMLVSTFGTAVQAQNSPATTTFIKAYSNFIASGQADVTPEDVQATTDGGYILLSASGGPTGGASWLVKIDPTGNTQWVKEVGVFNPSVSFALGTSVQQTRDGGYIIAGGTVGGGSSGPCSPRVDFPCALVEKVNSSGDVEWSFVYFGGAQGSTLSQIRQTVDGGYIAVGGTSFEQGIYGALILKLDRAGNVLWQKVLGPQGSKLAALTQVLNTADGGFATLGFTYVPRDGSGIESVLVAKYTAVGVLQWQIAYNKDNGTQVPISFAQTSDGGYIVGGATSTMSGNAAGGLLLKLGPRGNIQWEKAYSSALGGNVIYSVHQTADGGYVLAGDSSSPACDGLVPWMTKVDSSGNLLWEHLYFAIKSNGCPASEYFASSDLTADGGILAVGWTEDPQSLRGDLYVVKTDSAGLCSSGCSEIYPVPQQTATNISLTAMPPILAVNTQVIPGVTSLSQSEVTTAVVRQHCD